MTTRAFAPPHTLLGWTPVVLLVLLGAFSSCKKSPTGPAGDVSVSTLQGIPGTPLTQTNDAGDITWLPNGLDIAYTSLTFHGGYNSGVLKAVNVNSRGVRTLDGTDQFCNWLHAEGDSIFYFSNRASTGLGLYVVSTSGNGGVPERLADGSYTVIAPDCGYTANVNLTPDSVRLIHLRDRSAQVYPLQPGELPVTFSPDSKQLLFSTGRLLTVADGTNSMFPYPMITGATVRWTTDGIRALTWSATPAPSFGSIDVYTLTNLITRESKDLWRSDGSSLGGPVAMSRDGKKVAFMRCTMNTVSPTVHSLYVYDLSSGSSTKLFEVPVRLGIHAIPGIDSFAFSPDGTMIAYAVEGNIYYCNL